ncbi:type II toxin-antitoxin system VapC family toxin [Akkermansiaceae bacterium]|nr:type II toxin-antitoxin system VapC family toxin [Akkermansiaceae bacterium]
MLYLDISALLKLYLLEKGSEKVNRLVIGQDEPLPICEFQEMELINALHLKVFWKELDQAQLEIQLSYFDERKAKGLYYFPEINRPQLQHDFRKLAAQTPIGRCRTLDILHVACALQLSVSQFVGFDERQRLLARHAGLTVWGGI